MATETADQKAEREKNEAAVKAAIDSGELKPEPEAPKNEIKSKKHRLIRVAGGGQQFANVPEQDDDGNDLELHPDDQILVHLDYNTFDGLGRPEAIEVAITASK